MPKNELTFQALKKILTPREINYCIEVELSAMGTILWK